MYTNSKIYSRETFHFIKINKKRKRKNLAFSHITLSRDVPVGYHCLRRIGINESNNFIIIEYIHVHIIIFMFINSEVRHICNITGLFMLYYLHKINIIVHNMYLNNFKNP